VPVQEEYRIAGFMKVYLLKIIYVLSVFEKTNWIF